MDPLLVERIVGLLLIVAGWEIGKQTWAAKGADPRRGRWYGAALCFLFGALGLLALIGIAVRWHPASEPTFGDLAPPPHRPVSLRRTALAGLAALTGAAAIVVGLAFAADAVRYGGWSEALPPGDPVMRRADCTRVTGDWDVCYVPRAERRTALDWRNDWDGRRLAATGAAALALLAGVAAWAAFFRLRRAVPAPDPVAPTSDLAPSPQEPALTDAWPDAVPPAPLGSIPEPPWATPAASTTPPASTRQLPPLGGPP